MVRNIRDYGFCMAERINSQSQPENFTTPRILCLLVHMSDLGPYDSNLAERIFDYMF